MKISAVIPCYNGEKFIREAINSINSQTYSPIEIVVVDDGSSDSTAQILTELIKVNPIPIIIVSQINSGVSAARNVGIATASGDWIAFLDVDDIWLPEMLSEKVNFAKQCRMTSGLICNDYYVDEMTENAKKHNVSTVAHKTYDRKIVGVDFQRFLIEDYFIGTATVMMFSRLDALRIGGFDCFMKHSEDFDFVLRFTCQQDVVILSQPLALKRHHGENLSNNKELYFYSHAFSSAKNLQYKSEYSRGGYTSEIKSMLRADVDKFMVGYCNEVYERNWYQGLSAFFVNMFKTNTLKGFCYHMLSFAKKLLRTLSFGLLRKQKT